MDYIGVGDVAFTHWLDGYAATNCCFSVWVAECQYFLHTFWFSHLCI